MSHLCNCILTLWYIFININFYLWGFKYWCVVIDVQYFYIKSQLLVDFFTRLFAQDIKLDLWVNVFM